MKREHFVCWDCEEWKAKPVSMKVSILALCVIGEFCTWPRSHSVVSWYRFRRWSQILSMARSWRCRSTRELCTGPTTETVRNRFQLWSMMDSFRITEIWKLISWLFVKLNAISCRAMSGTELKFIEKVCVCWSDIFWVYLFSGGTRSVSSLSRLGGL